VARPRLPIGTHGSITALTLPGGRVEVRTRYRDGDGKTRQVSVRAASRSAATTELKRRLAARNLYQPVDTTLTLDSLFPDLVEYWLADLDLDEALDASEAELAAAGADATVPDQPDRAWVDDWLHRTHLAYWAAL
jgi:hypothetical protein